MPEQNVIRTIRIRGTSEGLDKLTGDLGKLASAQENVAVVSEQSARRQLSLEQAWKRQTLQLDENARMQNRIARETKIADGALREGIITQQQHAERLNLITQRYAAASNATTQFTAKTGLARHELINLSRQAQDVGVSLASGQSPLTVLVQQGSQIADVFASSTAGVRGFATQAIGWLGRFATSAAGVVTGIGAIGAGALYMAGSWSEAQREIDKALIGLGRRSGVTAKDINDIARSSATATGLSVGEAREAALEFVKTGAIYRDNIRAAVAVTHDFAIVTGKDAKDAAKDLGAALASPLDGADALNSKIGFLDGRTREYIATLVSQNQKQEAQAVLLRSLGPAIQDATNTLGPFEKAWNAVANAAIGAKNAIGAALTPSTTEERRDTLVGAINQSEAPRLEGTPVSTRDLDKSKVAAMRLEVEALNESLRETARARALAFEGDKKVSFDADEAVRTLLPYIDQLKKVDELLAKIKLAQDSPGGKDRQGLGASNEAAARAAEVLKMNIKATADETDRANASALRLAASYGTASIEVARTLDGLSRQLGVAQAVGGMAQIEAQHKARIAELSQRLSDADAKRIADGERAVSLAQIESQHKHQMVALQGQLSVAEQSTGIGQINAQYEATVELLTLQVGEAKAVEQAELQRAINIAQANAGADQMLRSLQQQAQLLDASSGAERDRIAAQQTYQNLLDKGVDKYKAQAVASQQLANSEKRRAEEERRAAEEAIRNIRSRADAWAAVQKGVLSWGVANQEATKRELANAHAAEEAAVAQNRAATSMFNAAQAAVIAFNAFVPFATTYAGEAPGALAPNGVVTNKSGGRTQFNPEGYQSKTSLATNMSLGTRYTDPWSEFYSALGGGLAKAGTTSLGGGPGIDADKLASLERLIAIMPENQQASATQSLLQDLNQRAPSIERDEAINRLTKSLDQLRQSTDSLTQAMTDVLSPLYQTDTRQTHQGFRAFAGGGIMTPWGEMPLHKYDGGGIATSPQVAVFGEGRTPEAYVPVPNGQIPVEIRQPANSNDRQRPIQVNITVQGNATPDTVAALKTTAFQQAQAMRRALG